MPVSYAFPTFLESMSALMQMTADGRLFEAYAETLRPLIIGIAISAVVGIIVSSIPNDRVVTRVCVCVYNPRFC